MPIVPLASTRMRLAEGCTLIVTFSLVKGTNVTLEVVAEPATLLPTSCTGSPGRFTPGPKSCTLLGAVAHCPAVACVDSTWPRMRKTFEFNVLAVYQSCGLVEPEVIPVPFP